MHFVCTRIERKSEMPMTAQPEKYIVETTDRGFEQIIGSSPALESVFKAVELVAPTDSTVLIQGETGTGKELIARAIHKISPRCNQPFIVVNCAAIPSDLLESELFGYERGAFTGAMSQKIGRIESAHKGTLFLDEIGYLRPGMQPKLLRLLQEREFERLGGTRTHSVDVRLVAASNKNLAELVERDEFRSDLFYRLNIFPIVLPPLRERRDDIAPLVRHFVERFSRRMGRTIHSIPAGTLTALSSYEWPGNIRELQNMIERAVIFSTDGVLLNSLDFGGTAQVRVGSKPSSLHHMLDAAERDLILQALNRTNWVIGGESGAAAMLGLKRTGLIYKMRRLGISRGGKEVEGVDSDEKIVSIDASGKKGTKGIVALQQL